MKNPPQGGFFLPATRQFPKMVAMPSKVALFPALLASVDWSQLALPVRRVHAEGNLVRASGIADVAGETHLVARWLRRLLSLPDPGAGRPSR